MLAPATIAARLSDVEDARGDALACEHGRRWQLHARRPRNRRCGGIPAAGRWAERSPRGSERSPRRISSEQPSSMRSARCFPQQLGPGATYADVARLGHGPRCGKKRPRRRCWAALGSMSDLIGDAADAHARAGAEFAKSRASVTTAADRLSRALAPGDGAPGSHDPTINPTAAMGAQVSDGREPRATTPEEIRQRDQLRGCRASYDAEMRRLNGGGHRR